jgi:glycosyltransferase involved in cell wall biosynthesis
MRIGIDASRATIARRTGTESYALRLIQALLERDSDHDFLLYFRDAPAPGLFSRGTLRVMPFPRLWTHARLSFELLASPRPDVLFVPAHVLPMLHPVPSVVTVHDLGYKYFPGAHPLTQRLYLNWSTRFSARSATHVIADSQATRQDLIHFYNIPARKITVVYPGRDESFHRVDPAPVRAKYNLPETYFLHVGTIQPRKNLIRLIEAVCLLPAKRAHCLLLVGRPGWLAAPILAKAREQADTVRLLDYVPDEDLGGLYSGACAFVFPSLYEGFGFPVLEAMACGAPVICSNTSSLPELAGEAALLVDPTDTAALAAAMRRALSEPELRKELIEKGYAQIQKFSWAKAAGKVLSVLEEAVQSEGVRSEVRRA